MNTLPTDPLSLVAYIGLGLCAVRLVADGISTAKFHLHSKFHARETADILQGNRSRSIEKTTLPKRLASTLARTEPNSSNEVMMEETTWILSSFISKRASTVIRCAPALGVAGTMSGAMVFLTEFDQSTLTGRPSMNGLTDATATTWIGLILMILAILLKNYSDLVVDLYARRTLNFISQ